MSLRCKIGLHKSDRESVIPVHLKMAYRGSKRFLECECGKKSVVETYGGFHESRDPLLEELTIEEYNRKMEQEARDTSVKTPVKTPKVKTTKVSAKVSTRKNTKKT